MPFPVCLVLGTAIVTAIEKKKPLAITATQTISFGFPYFSSVHIIGPWEVIPLLCYGVALVVNDWEDHEITGENMIPRGHFINS